MTQWVRFERDGRIGFGTLDGDTIAVHGGDMFAGAKPTGETVKRGAVKLLAPCEPSKMVCLWNNFHQLAAKNNFAVPPDPLYFLKGNNAFCGPDTPIERPKSYSGRIVYEGELGIVIGKKCSMVSEAEASAISSATPASTTSPRSIC